MGIVLAIADVGVVLAIVASVPRAVWKGQAPSPGATLLSVCIIVAMLVFGLVSLSAASGLIDSSSSASHVAFLIFLIATAIVLRVWWAKKPAQ